MPASTGEFGSPGGLLLYVNSDKICNWDFVTLPLCSHRTALTIVIFVARAFIAAGFQVTFVYTPEVRQYFTF